MAANFTPLQAVSLLRSLLPQANDGIAGDLPISKAISEAFDATEHLISPGSDDMLALAPGNSECTAENRGACPNCDFGTTHEPWCKRVAGPPALREQFEKHMLERDKAVMLERKADGSYASWFTDRYWMTWMAAHDWTKDASDDAARLNWFDKNILHREKNSWDQRAAPASRMWVFFAPEEAQGTARKILDAARALDDQA